MIKYLRSFILGLFVVTAFAEEPLLKSKPVATEENLYKLRLMYGWGYDNTLQELVLEGRGDRFENVSEVGIFVERYLHKNLWDKNVELSLQLGYIRHDEDGLNNFVNQYNAGLKLYWTRFPWSGHVRTKIFTTGGISYTDKKLWLELEDDDDVSNFLFYLELGIEVNLADITRIKSLEHCYLGGGISHRSGIFGVFDGVHGGSNYPMVFISIEF